MAEHEAAPTDNSIQAHTPLRALRWRRGARWFAAEFLVVVTSVLFELALNAWWEASQEHRREELYLNQLRSDLRINKERLEEAIRLEQTTRAGAEAVIAALSAATPITVDSARTWMIERRASFYSDPRLLRGTVSALMETGDINLLRNAVVRQRVIEYQSQTESDQVEFGRWVDRLAEYLQDFYSGAVGSERWREMDANLPHQVRALVAGQSDRTLLRPFFGMYWTSGVRMTYLQRMLDETTTLSAALDQ